MHDAHEVGGSTPSTPTHPPILNRDFFLDRILSERPKAPGGRATGAIEMMSRAGGLLVRSVTDGRSARQYGFHARAARLDTGT
jgi:hypothetical protein